MARPGLDTGGVWRGDGVSRVRHSTHRRLHGGSSEGVDPWRGPEQYLVRLGAPLPGTGWHGNDGDDRLWSSASVPADEQSMVGDRLSWPRRYDSPGHDLSRSSIAARPIVIPTWQAA